MDGHSQELRPSSPDEVARALMEIVSVDRLRTLEEHPSFQGMDEEDDAAVPLHLQLVGADYEGEVYAAACALSFAEVPEFQGGLSQDTHDGFFSLYLSLWEYVTEPPPWVTDVRIN